MTPEFPRRGRDLAPSLVFALAALLMAPSAPAGAQPPTAIDWRGDLPRAQAEASTANRLVWLQFTGPSCPNCRRMDAEAFVHPAVVGQALHEFVPVKLRADRHENLAANFGLSYLPATVILRPSGEVVSRVQGYSNPDTFLHFLRDAVARSGRVPPASVAVNQRPSRGDRPDSRRPAAGGYCLVSLVEAQRLVVGSPSFAVDHQGATYQFADERARESFHKAASRFVPVGGGFCPVARVDQGDSKEGSPRWGVLYDGHLYLCASDADRQRFLKRPERYARVDEPHKSSCPYCWALEGGIVQDRLPRSLTRVGRAERRAPRAAESVTVAPALRANR